MKILKHYRHIICIAVTITLVVLGVFVFNGSVWRVVESICDFATSFTYSFLDLFDLSDKSMLTLLNLPQKTPWSDFLYSPIPKLFLPSTWGEFGVTWSKYWELWIDWRTFALYLLFIAEFVLNVMMYTYHFFLLYLLAKRLFRRYLRKHNNDDDKDSKRLTIFKRIMDKTYRPVRRFFVDLYVFIKNSVYWKIWACMLILYAGGFSIALVTLAFFSYFTSSFDFTSMYNWFYKIVWDLSLFFEIMPALLTIIGLVVAYELLCHYLGYKGLYHRERCNRGFLNERGVVTIVWGEMGVGKTALITDCMLSAEVQLRDDAYEIILESDMKFPNFTWATFERQLRQAIYFHVIYDVWSCRRWIRKKRAQWNKANCKERIFGYDYERYGLTYDDKLKEVNVWQVLEDYACAYLIYTVQSSLIIANYSVRVDSLLYDLDNFPLWNTDFFKRDSRLLDSFSRHCKILDFDMLRLGKIMLENNPNRNAYGFGVYGITELDKERKNTPELKDVKATEEECNQKNDLFNVLLKMSRHACVIANRVFVKVFADLQRPDSLGADCRELGEVTYIENKSDIEPVLPFFSLYYIFEWFIDLVFQPFADIYAEYRFNRSDNTLPLYLFKNAEAKLQHIKERTRNVFGSATLTLELQNGRMDGEPQKRKWYRMPKKIYSRRYTTDCQQAIFERRAEMNFIGVDDLREYAEDMANGEELIYQNSHMQVELLRCVA